jgi:stage III sporulation protein SpoIIIAA
MTQKHITDNLDILMGVLPPEIADAVRRADRSELLIEIILDQGRVPTARFYDHEVSLLEREVTAQDISAVVKQLGDFDADNRAGLERTLHRISAIRNRHNHIVGLTCRVGRAVYGTIDIIEDLIESGKSLLLLGKPGVGKTTMLREAARMLAENHRVVIVDTSNEIGGDGDVPHPAVGRARRMQVPKPSLQHEVMIEAVENHNPEVIVIDEIGRELEAQAARTIAERGVQLIGTAHGRTLENLLLNPTLSDLVGGIESVTLSDEEARRRGTQKTVLERRSPPTFDILIELLDRDRVAIHADVASAVDALVRGYPGPVEVRYHREDGSIAREIQTPEPSAAPATGSRPGKRGTADFGPPMGVQGTRRQDANRIRGQETPGAGWPVNADTAGEEEPAGSRTYDHPNQPIRLYPYGVARNRLSQAAKRLGVPVMVVRDVADAQGLITLRAYYRNRQATILDAEGRGMPVYVLRSNTVSQMEQFLAEIFNLNENPDANPASQAAVAQAQSAVDLIRKGERFVDLPPAAATLRRLQHEVAKQNQLTSQSYGKEPYRRVRIFRE